MTVKANHRQAGPLSGLAGASLGLGLKLGLPLSIALILASGLPEAGQSTRSGSHLFCSQAKAASTKQESVGKNEANSKSEPPTEAEQPANWTPVLMSTTGTMQPFKGSEGLWNIVYEIELASYLPDPIVMDSIEVLDGSDQKKALIHLEGQDLNAVMLSPSSACNSAHNSAHNSDQNSAHSSAHNSAYKNSSAHKEAKNRAIGAGGLAIAFINITLKEKSDAPATVLHRIQYHTTSGKEANKEETIVSTMRRLDKSDPVVISPPLDGGRWLAAGGYSGKLGHRRAIFPIDNHLVLAQRYAIDWVRLDEKDHTSHGDAAKVDDYACYGQPIYAVADGKVVGTIGRFPDQKPPQPSGDKYFAGGNIIVLEIGKDLYAFYAHCKPGSILVKDGDMVKRGQQIAAVGNTGNSTGPHLHMHITTGPKPLGSMSVPYVFDNFEVVGEVEDIDKFADNDEHGRKQTFKTIAEHGPRHNELVKEGHIVTFKIQKADLKK